MGNYTGGAFIWDPQNGIRDLQAVAIAQGADLTDRALDTATGISDDGTVIAGTVNILDAGGVPTQAVPYRLVIDNPACVARAPSTSR